MSQAVGEQIVDAAGMTVLGEPRVAVTFHDRHVCERSPGLPRTRRPRPDQSLMERD